MANYYVNRSTGNNGNSGALGDEWRDLSYAVTQVSNGDTIYVQTATTYPDDINTTATYPDNITIRAYTPASPAVMTPGDPWDISYVTGWTIQDLSFQNWSYGGLWRAAIEPGWTARTYDFAVDGCTFKHSTRRALTLQNVDGFTMRDCHLRDIRSRIVGQDMHAVVVSATSYLKDGLIEDSVFEDIGCDGFGSGPGAIIDGCTVRRCAFIINRPYSTSGTSLYNGDTTIWQNFDANVGENGLDMKGPAQHDDILAVDCLFANFSETVVGQDASGSDGPGIVVGKDATMTMQDCVFYNCNMGAKAVKLTETTCGMILQRCFLHRCDAASLYTSGANMGVTVDDCEVIDSNVLTLRFGDTTFDSIKRNLFIDGACQRITPMTGEANFGYNLWKNCTPPAQWAKGNDLTEATVDIVSVSTLDGGIEIEYRLSGTDLHMRFHDVTLRYHPSLANLYTDIDKAMLTGTTTTITKESSDPQVFSVLFEQ